MLSSCCSSCSSIFSGPLHHIADRYYSDQTAQQNQQTLDLYVTNLLGTLRRYEDLPPVLGELPAANLELARIRARTGADVIYLMQPDGLTRAASNWDQPDSFVGRNFAFRPYYKEAMQGRLAHLFGLGTTSKRRGYFFASEVRDADTLLGVLVVKVDLEHMEQPGGNTPDQLLVMDADGVVILSSNKAWRFHTSRKLSPAKQREIAENIPYPVLHPLPLKIDQRPWTPHNARNCSPTTDRATCGNCRTPRNAMLWGWTWGSTTAVPKRRRPLPARG